jgi:hypothetical protein
MRRRILPAVAVVSLMVLISQTAWALDWKSFAPAGYARKTRISVGGKELTYYLFDDETPLSFSVDGPTRVKILTRVRIPNNREDLGYSVSVARDGMPVDTHSFDSRPKDGAFYVEFNSMRPGVIRRVYIDVPTGRHGYEIRSSSGMPVDARLFESAGSTPSRVSLAPRDFFSVETLLYREKELTYYMMDGDHGVTVDVVGPTELKVNTRLMYDATMLGSQTYVVGVRADGGDERLYRIDGEPSQSVVSRDREDVIPGALRHFFVDVPVGAHTYTFRLADGPAAEMAVKFYIPRGDLSNEP